MLKLNFKNSEDCLTYLFSSEKPNDLIYTSMYDAIYYAIANNLEIAVFAHFTFDNEPDLSMKIYESDFGFNLKSCLDYFVSVENYEICVKIRNLLSEIE